MTPVGIQLPSLIVPAGVGRRVDATGQRDPVGEAEESGYFSDRASRISEMRDFIGLNVSVSTLLMSIRPS